MVDKHPVRFVSKQLEVHENTLYRWVAEYEQYGERAFPGKGSREFATQKRKQVFRKRKPPTEGGAGYLKKVPSFSQAKPQVVFDYIKRIFSAMPVKRACAYLGVSRSGYYKFLHHTPSSLEIEDTTLAELIQTIFLSTKGDMVRGGYR
ncbi:transposase [Listeria monocytogenes]|nr:transposase [Listeria monocytogenes]